MGKRNRKNKRHIQKRIFTELRPVFHRRENYLKHITNFRKVLNDIKERNYYLTPIAGKGWLSVLTFNLF